MNKNSVLLYFIPLTGLEFIIMLGICQVVRHNFPSIRTVLLSTEHPRVKGKFERYYQFFDEVIDLPYCDFKRPFIEGYRDCRRFTEAVRRCTISPRSIVFGCEMNGLVHILLAKEIRKRFSSKQVLLASLNPYVALNDGMSVAIKNTILMNAYSIPLAGILMVARMEKKAKWNCGRELRSIQDVTLFIEQEGKASQCAVFHNLPFPGKLLNLSGLPDLDEIRVEDNAIILFLDSSIPRLGFCEESFYWHTANKLAREIALKNPGCPLYIKFHPQDLHRYTERIQSTPVRFVDNRYSAEEIYLQNRSKIRAVYSHGSTAILTASWLGITSFNCTKLFEYRPSIIEVLDKYLSSGKNITDIACYEDVIDLKQQSNISTNHIASDASLWRGLIDTLIDMLV